ncbi:hypothetical protein D6774_00190 [Candidatus Woesearchaeota archaeon]|jgi:hypothetical protein|nr:MAG: hypothetical protein D6774_00190 [Candidatus Woesearchaeota archaeon]
MRYAVKLIEQGKARYASPPMELLFERAGIVPGEYNRQEFLDMIFAVDLNEFYSDDLRVAVDSSRRFIEEFVRKGSDVIRIYNTLESKVDE